jgi:hypothetical protein
VPHYETISPGLGYRGTVRLIRRHPDGLAVIGLVLLPFAVLGRALLPGRVLSPADILLVFPPWSIVAPGLRMANSLLTDVTFMFHPWLIYAGREVGEGRFPLWNPQTFTGSPFFANPQTALLFPLTWLAFLLPPPLAVTLISILKFSIAGAGTYVFLRLLEVRRGPALVGAVAFMFNAALVTWVQWAVGTAMAMLPWLFAATEHLRRSGRRPAVALLALTVALSLLGGYLQITAVAVLAAGAWAATRTGRAPHSLPFLGAWALGVTLGGLVAAVQLLPFLEYSRLSSVYAYRSQWMPVMAAPAHAAVALLMPRYFGTPVDRDFWGYWNYNEIAGAVGLVPWLALPAALLAWRRPGTRFFLAMTALAGVLCYDTPGITETLGGLPPLSLMITFRLVIFLAFGLSVLCAFGLDALAARAPGRGRRAVAVAAGFVVVAGLALAAIAQDAGILARTRPSLPVAWQFGVFLGLLALSALAALWLLRSGATPGWRGAAAASAALAGLQLASAADLAVRYNPVIETRLFYPPAPPALGHVQVETSKEGGRVMFGIGKNMGMLYGLSEVTGYDGMTPRLVEQIISPAGAGGLLASGSVNATVDWGSPLFDLLGVRRLIVPGDVDRLAPHFTMEYDGPDARVFVNPRAMPRAFVVGGARCVDEEQGLETMLAGRVDFRREVLLSDCAAQAARGDAGPAIVASLPRADAGPVAPAHAEIRAARPDTVVVGVQTAAPAWLVLTDTWFPGWQVTVDGQEQALWRANHAFRAVRVPSGAHEVVFRYRPTSLLAGLALSALGGLGVAGVLLVPGRRRAPSSRIAGAPGRRADAPGNEG